MARLEDLTRGAAVRGVAPNGTVTVVDVKWYGTAAVELTYKDTTGRPGNQLLYRDDEARLEIVTAGRPWSFDADGHLLRLVSEAQRIRWAHLFDPYLAVHTSLVDPLPHQITAVYGQMLPRQHLRYLLADDPGAGKTIMAGLLIKELRIRGDLQRCLVVCPGNLVEEWQDELYRRFHLPFEILTAFNKPEDWILALVEVPPEGELPGDWTEPAAVQVCPVRYLRRPFQQEPDFAATSVNYSWSKLWNRGVVPG